MQTSQCGMETVGWGISFEMQQHQLAGLAERNLQHCPRPMYFDPSYARALQAVDDAEEKVPHHVNVQCRILVRWQSFSLHGVLTNCCYQCHHCQYSSVEDSHSICQYNKSYT
jgi:hypothetical protein